MIDQRMQSIHEFATEVSRAADEKVARDEKQTVWVFIWTLFAFKLATAVAIFWAAGGTMDATEILAATHWFWMFLPAFVVAGPIALHMRLRKARRRRLELQRSEWMTGH